MVGSVLRGIKGVFCLLHGGDLFRGVLSFELCCINVAPYFQKRDAVLLQELVAVVADRRSNHHALIVPQLWYIPEVRLNRDSSYIPKSELSLRCRCLCHIPVLCRFVLRAFALWGSNIHPDMCSPFSCPSSTGNTGSHIHCSPTTYHTLSHKHLLHPRQGMKKARLPTQASLWVTDALCTVIAFY